MGNALTLLNNNNETKQPPQAEGNEISPLEPPNSFNCKRVIIIGDPGVGKTEIWQKIVQSNEDNQSECLLPETNQQIRYTKTVQMQVCGEEYLLNLQVVDLEEPDPEIEDHKPKIREADGYIVVYDINDSESYLSVDGWLHEIGVKNKKHKKVILLLGNKLDITKENEEANRQIPLELAQEYALNHKLIFQEISATTQENLYESLNEFFVKLCRASKKKKEKKPSTKGNKLEKKYSI